MSLRSIPKVLEKKRRRIWVEVLPADEKMDLPAVEFYEGFISPTLNDQIASDYRKKDGSGLDLSGDKIKKFRKDVLLSILFQGFKEGDEPRWRGMSKQNLIRLCPSFMENPELLEDVEDPIDFNQTNVQVVAEEIFDDYFMKSYTAAQDLSTYSKEALQEAKN